MFLLSARSMPNRIIAKMSEYIVLELAYKVATILRIMVSLSRGFLILCMPSCNIKNKIVVGNWRGPLFHQNHHFGAEICQIIL